MQGIGTSMVLTVAASLREGDRRRATIARRTAEDADTRGAIERLATTSDHLPKAAPRRWLARLG